MFCCKKFARFPSMGDCQVTECIFVCLCVWSGSLETRSDAQRPLGNLILEQSTFHSHSYETARDGNKSRNTNLEAAPPVFLPALACPASLCGSIISHLSHPGSVISVKYRIPLNPPSCHIWRSWCCLMYTDYFWSLQTFWEFLDKKWVTHPVSLPPSSPLPTAVTGLFSFCGGKKNRDFYELVLISSHLLAVLKDDQYALHFGPWANNRLLFPFPPPCYSRVCIWGP